MAGQWYYHRRGERFGPVRAGVLKRLADLGQLDRADLLWKDGLPNWIAASKLQGLFADSPPAESVVLPDATLLPATPPPAPPAETPPPKLKVRGQPPKAESETGDYEVVSEPPPEEPPLRPSGRPRRRREGRSASQSSRGPVLGAIAAVVVCIPVAAKLTAFGLRANRVVNKQSAPPRPGVGNQPPAGFRP